MRSVDLKICLHFSGGASDLVFWSFRYFVGRMTIATCSFAIDLASAWDLLDGHTRKSIERELEELFRQDDDARARGDEHLPLGMDCDRQHWELVRAKYYKSPTKNKGECEVCERPYHVCLCSHEN